MPSNSKNNNLTVGLDIGTTKICAIAVEGDDIEALNVVGVGTAKSDGLRKGVVVNIEKTVKAIKKAVEECELMCGAQIRSVFAGIAGHHIRGQNSRGMVTVYHNRIVTDEDIRRVIDAAQVLIPNDREVLHILPQEFIVDDQDGVQNPLGMAAARLEVNVHIVTGSVTSAQNIIKCCNQSGLDVEDIVLEPLSSSQAVLSPDEQEVGVVLVDIGGGTTEIAVLSLGGVVYSNSIRIAGDAMDQAIISYMRKKYNLLVGEASAEKIKKEIGTAFPTSNNTYLMKGRDIRSGTPKEISLREEDTSEALQPILSQILNAVKDALENTPPELSADLVDMGLTLTGGGSLLKNIDKLISKETGLPVMVADDPLACVAIGTGKALDNEDIFSTMLSEY